MRCLTAPRSKTFIPDILALSMGQRSSVDSVQRRNMVAGVSAPNNGGIYALSNVVDTYYIVLDNQQSTQPSN